MKSHLDEKTPLVTKLRKGDKVRIQPRHADKIVQKAKGSYAFARRKENQGCFYKNGQLTKVHLSQIARL